MKSAPKIDKRTASGIAKDLRALIKTHTPEWKGAGESGDFGDALVRIFARYAEIVIERLNRAPKKNLLAYIDMLGESQRPPQPARVPLTFFLSAGSATDAVVPAGTQAAAPPAEGETAPVIFETERELTVVAASLDKLFVREVFFDRTAASPGRAPPLPNNDKWTKYRSADLSNLCSAAVSADRKRVIVDYVNEITAAAYRHLSERANTEAGRAAIKQWSAELATLTGNNIQHIETITSDQLRDFLRRFDALSDDEAALIDDYDYYLRTGARRAFTGTAPIDHSLYIGLDDLLGRAGLTELHIQFEVASASPPLDPPKLLWSVVDGAGEKEITLTADRDAETGRVSFYNLPVVPQRAVNNLRSRWLRGCLQTPITPRDKPPKVRIAISAVLSRQGVPITLAFANTTPLDTTKDFLPFGERPRLGDTLYLSAGDSFDMAGADVTLKFEASAPPPPASPPATPSLPPTLKWEYWDGERWAELAELRDCTAALTKSGEVKFRLEAASPPATSPPRPASPKKLIVNGAEGFWLRVRISAGNYGEDAKYVPEAATYKYIPPTLAPPSIAAITVAYSVTLPDQHPDQIMTCNDFYYQQVEVEKAFEPFRPTEDTVPTLYLGFALPEGRQDFPNRAVGIFFGIDELPDDRSSAGSAFRSVSFPATKQDLLRLARANADDPIALRRVEQLAEGTYSSLTDLTSALLATVVAKPTRLVWECWTGEGGWQRPGLRDDTRGLTHSGVFEFLVPGNFARRREFGAARYWLRCRWEAGDFTFEPRLRQVALNTVMAEQASTILEETLGSSDASPGQRFATAHRPILHGQEELRVREPELPSAEERKKLVGEDAVSVTPDVAGRPVEIWVRWQEVPDFHGSTPRNRHYVLDHVAGTVGFGDGINGLIPPPGVGNLQLMRYRTGGGSPGNRNAHTIVQLTTTIPFIDRVTNPEPARGGADAETIEALLERAPRAIRHRYRAVTMEDYEDLALLASPEVARAKCVPLRDLSSGRDESFGAVSVVIVPRSTEAKPVPSLVLRERIAAYLDARRPAGAENLAVVGPDYVEVKIEAEVGLTAIERASEVQPRVVEALRRFLHPLTGGFDGSGWDFGRRLHKSDLYRLIDEIPGVDHVGPIVVTPDSDQSGQTGGTGAEQYTPWSLVYAGAINITVTAAAPENAVT